jgi:hypothetical protein
MGAQNWTKQISRPAWVAIAAGIATLLGVFTIGLVTGDDPYDWAVCVVFDDDC